MGKVISDDMVRLKELSGDPALVARYLDAYLETGSQKELLPAIRKVAKATVGVANVARSAHLNSTSIYRTLSEDGNPDLRNLTQLLSALNLRLSIQPMDHRP